MHAKNFVTAALVLSLSACNYYRETRYAAYEQAVAIPRQIADPPIFNLMAKPQDLPGSVCYAVVEGDFHQPGPFFQATELRAQAIKRGFDPDYMIYREAGAAAAGAVTQPIGMGMFMTTPVYRHGAAAWCYRICPARAGFRVDDNQMLLEVDEAVRKAAGIQEGDTILSVNGKAVKPDAQGFSPASLHYLTMEPGQLLTLVWIRPGTGRMEGTSRALPPLPMTEAKSMLFRSPEEIRGNFRYTDDS